MKLSYDVVNFYPSIPVWREAAVIQILSNYTDLKNRTKKRFSVRSSVGYNKVNFVEDSKALFFQKSLFFRISIFLL